MRVLVAGLAVLLLIGAPGPAKAGTVDDVERLLLDWINDARNERGLDDLRSSSRLWDIAGYRASRMASTSVLSHTIAGNIGSQLNAKRMPWYSYGEDIGYSPQRYGTPAAAELFRLWKASPSHWTLMMSARYNYIGVGMSYRSSSHRWYSSLIFTESPDLTGARAVMLDVVRNGDDVRWTWQGWDPALQTHTAGLREFDVQTRVDSGAWKTAIDGTTSSARTSRDLDGGHWYGVRVRAVDGRGNEGPYTPEIRVWVP
jgi:Cysteine-rich secretory protein family